MEAGQTNKHMNANLINIKNNKFEYPTMHLRGTKGVGETNKQAVDRTHRHPCHQYQIKADKHKEAINSMTGLDTTYSDI